MSFPSQYKKKYFGTLIILITAFVWHPWTKAQTKTGSLPQGAHDPAVQIVC